MPLALELITEREIHWEAKTHRSFSSTNYC